MDYTPYIIIGDPEDMRYEATFYLPRIRHHKVLGIEWHTAYINTGKKRIFRCARTEEALVRKWDKAIGPMDDETMAFIEMMLTKREQYGR